MSGRGSAACGTCGACCRSYVVTLFGEDVWRLSRGLRLAPEEFVLAHPQAEPTTDGFLFQRDGVMHGLALDKQGRFRDTQPCVFLLELGGGQTRCGAYEHRPVVCRAYPMSLAAGRVGQRADALCPPGAWPGESEALAAWRGPLQRLRMAWDVYAEVAARWNARVSSSPPEREFGLSEYLGYVLNVYDRIDRLNRELGVVDNSPPGVRQRYVQLVREAIGGFYPQVSSPPGCPAAAV